MRTGVRGGGESKPNCAREPHDTLGAVAQGRVRTERDQASCHAGAVQELSVLVTDAVQLVGGDVAHHFVLAGVACTVHSGLLHIQGSLWQTDCGVGTGDEHAL
jgi:hypothetical protein